MLIRKLLFVAENKGKGEGEGEGFEVPQGGGIVGEVTDTLRVEESRRTVHQRRLRGRNNSKRSR